MKLRHSLVLALSVSLFLLSGCTKQTPSLLRFNGVYQSEKVEDYWYYIRFYDDGTVITVSSTGNPTEIARWFMKENIVSKNLSHGHYEIKSGLLFFSSTSAKGTVDYEGEIQKDTLTLNSHSHINDFRRSCVYGFVQLSD